MRKVGLVVVVSVNGFRLKSVAAADVSVLRLEVVVIGSIIMMPVFISRNAIAAARVAVVRAAVISARLVEARVVASAAHFGGQMSVSVARVVIGEEATVVLVTLMVRAVLTVFVRFAVVEREGIG